uniref:Zinc finger MYM-type protein 1 n=1 Tax=Schizaphis graminum TaxID=13262 RepID=A0A2S2NBF1_SCHGA
MFLFIHFFYFQVDSTQDIGAEDQATLFIRYVINSEIKERLFAVLKVTDSSGKGYFEILKKCFNDHGIDFKKIIGESFDGAANMRGEFNGLRAHIQKENPKSVYVWCYAHTLNLCSCDSCSNIAAINLFGLLNRLSTFFSESYKRMDIWKKKQEQYNTGQLKLKKLQKIGNTRWWSREKALQWIFGGDDNLYATVISALDYVVTCGTFDSKTSSEAISLRDKLCEFQIILTAHLFLNIFSIVGITSTYLQSSNLDLLSAWEMVEKTIKHISTINFEDIFKEAEQFSEKINNSLEDLKLSENVIVECELPQPRIRSKKRMADELCRDEAPLNVKDKFRVEVFRCIIDRLQNDFTKRFSHNKILIADIQYLLPKHFMDVKEGLPDTALQKLSELASIDHLKLVTELRNFTTIYYDIVGPLNTKTKRIYSEVENDENYDNFSLEWNEFNIDLEKNACKQSSKLNHNRSKCLICVQKLLYSLNMHSTAYSNLYAAYEFVLSLSVSQVNCERAFSTLKIIKNRLRSSLNQERLEAFMMMSAEKLVLEEVDFQDVLEIIKNSSSLLLKLLS